MRIIVLLFVIQLSVSAQVINIVPYLKMIEFGNINNAKGALAELKRSDPDNPSVLFLEAVLTENGETANTIYLKIATHYPSSEYADASVFRIFSYYYSLGLYNKAEEYKELLINKYPSSPYIKAVDRNIPDQDAFTGISTPDYSVPSESERKNFTIQAGAFLNAANARNLYQRFIDEGFVSGLSIKEIGGSIFNIVTVGEFGNKAEADIFRDRLEKEYAVKGRVISRD
ncbi:MAG: SPOR domain-containing protein [Melioribacteraceae bacterium]|nr:SPOR domain-containing protein [Melioribacteraceae bacterium]